MRAKKPVGRTHSGVLLGHAPGFVLPVFSISGTDELYIQSINDLTGKVIDFMPIRLEGDQSVSFISSQIVGIGDSAIYAYRREANRVELGTLERLSAFLTTELTNSDAPASVKYQIATLLEDDRRIAYRNQVCEQLEPLGPSSIVSFNRSTLRSRLWLELHRAAADPEATREILSKRSELDVVYEGGSHVSLKLDSLSAGLRSKIDEQGIIDSLKASLGSYKETGRGDVAQQDDDPRLDYAQVLRAVRSSRRQEERLAIIIKALLLDREIGNRLLQEYRDQAQFANNSIGYLRATIGVDASRRQMEAVISAIIQRLFYNAYPMRRGEYLYYMAVHLASVSAVADVLAKLARSYYSQSVLQYRDLVVKLTENPNPLKF